MAERGRPKGSKTRRVIRAETIIRGAYPGYDPLKHLAELANDPELDKALRMQCSKELAQYMYPKRKAVELTGEDGGALQVVVRVVPHEG